MALRKELQYALEADAGSYGNKSTNNVANRRATNGANALVDTATGNVTTENPNTTKPTTPTSPVVKETNNNGGGNNGGGNVSDNGGSNTYVPTYEAPKISAPTYSQSQSVSDAYAYLQNIVNNKPGAFSSAYTNQLQSLYDSIMNRDKFSYDMANDALYQQYAKQYAQMGNQAMKNTMANATALTGGYGSSYASTAGNQAYQTYLSQLNNIAPELYSQAYSKYQNEGNDLLNQYQLTNNLYESDYNKYRDTVNDYQNNLNYAYNNYTNTRDFDYQNYLNNLNQYNYEVEQAYNRSQDALSQQNRDRDYAYQLGRDAVSDARYDAELQYQKDQDSLNNAINTLNSQSNIDTEKFKSSVQTLVNYGLVNEAMDNLIDAMSGASYEEIVKAAKGYGISENEIEKYIGNAKATTNTLPTLPVVGGGLKYNY